MAVVTMRQLLESGVHFGHQTRRWNPKMKRFIMTERNGIYIIDLQQSLAYIDRSYAFIKDTVAEGGTVMFVGTKKQAQEAIAEQATRVGMPYVNQRWLGGMLTNFQTVHQRINRLKELDEIDFDNVAGSGRTKKELLQMKRERDKLERTLGGIREMTRTPSAVWVVDTKKEHLAVEEARKLHIPIIGILDTNCDPDEVDFPIPGNDDAIRAVGLLTRVVADAVADGLIARSGAKAGEGDGETVAPRSRSPSGSVSCCRATPTPESAAVKATGGDAPAAAPAEGAAEETPAAPAAEATGASSEGTEAPAGPKPEAAEPTAEAADAAEPAAEATAEPAAEATAEPAAEDADRRCEGDGREGRRGRRPGLSPTSSIGTAASTAATPPPTTHHTGVQPDMANFSAADVKKLRDQTGAGMMDCKKALDEADGDFEAAVDILRTKGAAKAAKRGAEREATSGLVATSGGALVELNSETDFVAKNDEFIATAQRIAEAADGAKAADVESLKGVSARTAPRSVRSSSSSRSPSARRSSSAGWPTSRARSSATCTVAPPTCRPRSACSSSTTAAATTVPRPLVVLPCRSPR